MTVPPRLELALLPTPILKLERLSRRLGIELYVKRDDLTGLLESGGEVRKLEFLAAEAIIMDYVKAPGEKNVTKYDVLRKEFQAVVAKLTQRVSRKGK